MGQEGLGVERSVLDDAVSVDFDGMGLGCNLLWIENVEMNDLTCSACEGLGDHALRVLGTCVSDVRRQ